MRLLSRPSITLLALSLFSSCTPATYLRGDPLPMRIIADEPTRITYFGRHRAFHPDTDICVTPCELTLSPLDLPLYVDEPSTGAFAVRPSADLAAGTTYRVEIHDNSATRLWLRVASVIAYSAAAMIVSSGVPRGSDTRTALAFGVGLPLSIASIVTFVATFWMGDDAELVPVGTEPNFVTGAP